MVIYYSGFPQYSIVGPSCFLLHINNPGAICNSSFFNDDATTNSECGWTSVLWKQITLFLNLFISKLHKTIIHKAMHIGLITDYLVSVGDNWTAFIKSIK